MKIKRLAGPMAALAALTMVGTMPVSAQPGPNGWNREAFWRGAPADPYQRIDFLQAGDGVEFSFDADRGALIRGIDFDRVAANSELAAREIELVALVMII